MTLDATRAEGRAADARRADPEVVVVGGGNAGISAAMAAREAGCRVLLVERADRTFRGGNSRHTRDIRYAHEAADDLCPGPYSRQEFLADLASVAADGTESPLARLLVDRSAELPAWMSSHGVRWQQSLRGALHLSRTNAFFLGGGKALLNVYYETAERLGVEIAYGVSMVGIELAGGRCRAITLEDAAGRWTAAPAAVVLAAGGIEADAAWLRREWGEAADRFVVRGARTNDGTVLRLLLEAGIAPVGDARHFHSVPVDARSPRFDGGIVTRVDAVPFGIVLNEAGLRFHDEGETSWPKRYAVWGRLIAEQPGQQAWVLFDETVRRHFIPPVYPPLRASTLDGLLAQLPIPADAARATVEGFNVAVQTERPFDPSRLDGRSTVGITPTKSNWAVRLETPPFYAYPLCPGITFSYAGVRVDERAHAVGNGGAAVDNLLVAGELMAGNVLTDGYLAGVGLTIGTVFGRIAGEEAGRVAARSAH